MSTAADVIRDKGSHVYTVSPEATVLDAIARMESHGVGALVVVDEDGEIVGILTERDYLRKIVLMGRTSRTTAVRVIMSTPVTTVSPCWTNRECLALMTQRRIRHIPVVDDGELVGIVSMGDLVKRQVVDQRFEIRSLVEYIQEGATPVLHHFDSRHVVHRL
jgi:CBS domain-containing protein